MPLYNFKKMLLIFLLASIPLSGCMTPTIKRVSEFNSPPPFFPEVQFSALSKFKPDEIDCIAVGNFEDNSSQDDYSHLNKTKLVRAAVYGVLSAKNYRDIELNRVSYMLSNTDNNVLEELNCDALLSGQIVTFENSNFLAYSITTVEVILILKNLEGEILWQVKHAANSHEGSLPLSPLSLLTGVFAATANSDDEVAFQMIDTVARRTLAALPDRKSQNTSDTLRVTATSEPIKTLTKITSTDDTINPSYLLARGAYEEAFKEAKLLIKKQPDGVSGYTVAARASLLLDKFDEATNYALEALALDSANKDALSTAGYSYLKSNKLVLAEGAFRKIISLGNSESTDFHSLALVQLARKNIESASDNFLIAGKLAIKENESQLVYSNLSILQSLALSNASAKLAYEELGSLTWQFLYQK